jgi:hypothetical protein
LHVADRERIFYEGVGKTAGEIVGMYVGEMGGASAGFFAGGPMGSFVGGVLGGAGLAFLGGKIGTEIVDIGYPYYKFFNKITGTTQPELKFPNYKNQ